MMAINASNIGLLILILIVIVLIIYRRTHQVLFGYVLPDQYFYYNRELDKLESNIEKRLRPLGINDKIEMIHVDYEQNLWCMTGNKLYYYDFQDKKLQELSFPDKELSHIVSRQSYSCLLFSNGEIAQVDLGNKNCSENCSIRTSSLWRTSYIYGYPA